MKHFLSLVVWLSVGFFVGAGIASAETPTPGPSTFTKMDMSGSKFKSFDVAKFGKGKDAKTCPVSGDKIKPGTGYEAELSNGKKIMLCCTGCKRSVEKNLKKYASLEY